METLVTNQANNLDSYHLILTKVQFITRELQITFKKNTGRPMAIPASEIIAIALFKQSNGIPTKMQVYTMLQPKCSYKTLVIQMNNLSLYALYILKIIMLDNVKNAHVIKHTDSTDIPVSLIKNSKHHKTMEGLASYGYSAKGFYYGLRLSITTDLDRRLLNIHFTSANGNDRDAFLKMNKDIHGIFVADAGYISAELARKFYIENKRILFAKPKANMKKIMTMWQKNLYDTRMLIELNFRNLKLFYGIITSMPRSIAGYIANYIYSILAYVLA